MTILSKIIKEFDKITLIMKPLNKTNLNMLFLVKNHIIIVKQVNSLNTLINKVKNNNNEIDNMLFQQGMETFKDKLDSFQKLANLSSKIVELLLSQQIILTTNSIDNEFRLLSVSDKYNEEEYLNAIYTIVDKLSEKSDKDINLFINNAKKLIYQNNLLKEQVI